MIPLDSAFVRESFVPKALAHHAALLAEAAADIAAFFAARPPGARRPAVVLGVDVLLAGEVGEWPPADFHMADLLPPPPAHPDWGSWPRDDLRLAPAMPGAAAAALALADAAAAHGGALFLFAGQQEDTGGARALLAENLAVVGVAGVGRALPWGGGAAVDYDALLAPGGGALRMRAAGDARPEAAVKASLRAQLAAEGWNVAAVVSGRVADMPPLGGGAFLSFIPDLMRCLA